MRNRISTSPVTRAVTGSLAALALAAVLAGSTGCSNKPDVSRDAVLIPVEDTVAEQYAVAARQEREARGIFDTDTRHEELIKAIYAYQTVEERFPDDTFYTPAASVLVGDLYAEIDDYEAAIRQYRHVLESWPEDEQAHIAALMGMGEALDDLRRPEEAQTYYKMLIDQYQTSTAPEMRRLVEQARQRYRQIRPRV